MVDRLPTHRGLGLLLLFSTVKYCSAWHSNYPFCMCVSQNTEHWSKNPCCCSTTAGPYWSRRRREREREREREVDWASALSEWIKEKTLRVFQKCWNWASCSLHSSFTPGSRFYPFFISSHSLIAPGINEHIIHPWTPPINHQGGLGMTDDIRPSLYGKARPDRLKKRCHSSNGIS